MVIRSAVLGSNVNGELCRQQQKQQRQQQPERSNNDKTHRKKSSFEEKHHQVIPAEHRDEEGIEIDEKRLKQERTDETQPRGEQWDRECEERRDDRDGVNSTEGYHGDETSDSRCSDDEHRDNDKYSPGGEDVHVLSDDDDNDKYSPQSNNIKKSDDIIEYHDLDTELRSIDSIEASLFSGNTSARSELDDLFSANGFEEAMYHRIEKDDFWKGIGQFLVGTSTDDDDDDLSSLGSEKTGSTASSACSPPHRRHYDVDDDDTASMDSRLSDNTFQAHEAIFGSTPGIEVPVISKFIDDFLGDQDSGSEGTSSHATSDSDTVSSAEEEFVGPIFALWQDVTDKVLTPFVVVGGRGDEKSMKSVKSFDSAKTGSSAGEKSVRNRKVRFSTPTAKYMNSEESAGSRSDLDLVFEIDPNSPSSPKKSPPSSDPNRESPFEGPARHDFRTLLPEQMRNKSDSLFLDESEDVIADKLAGLSDVFMNLDEAISQDDMFDWGERPLVEEIVPHTESSGSNSELAVILPLPLDYSVSSADNADLSIEKNPCAALDTSPKELTMEIKHEIENIVSPIGFIDDTYGERKKTETTDQSVATAKMANTEADYMYRLNCDDDEHVSIQSRSTQGQSVKATGPGTDTVEGDEDLDSMDSDASSPTDEAPESAILAGKDSMSDESDLVLAEATKRTENDLSQQIISTTTMATNTKAINADCSCAPNSQDNVGSSPNEVDNSITVDEQAPEAPGTRPNIVSVPFSKDFSTVKMSDSQMSEELQSCAEDAESVGRSNNTGSDRPELQKEDHIDSISCTQSIDAFQFVGVETGLELTTSTRDTKKLVTPHIINDLRAIEDHQESDHESASVQTDGDALQVIQSGVPNDQQLVSTYTSIVVSPEESSNAENQITDHHPEIKLVESIASSDETELVESVASSDETELVESVASSDDSSTSTASEEQPEDRANFQTTKSNFTMDRQLDTADTDSVVKPDETSTTRFSFWKAAVDIEPEATVLTGIDAVQVTEDSSKSSKKHSDVRVEAQAIAETDVNICETTESEVPEAQQLDIVNSDIDVKSDESSTARFSFWQPEVGVESETSALTDIHTSQTTEIEISEKSENQQQLESEDVETNIFPSIEGEGTSRSGEEQPEVRAEAQALAGTDVHTFQTTESEVPKPRQLDLLDTDVELKSDESSTDRFSFWQPEVDFESEASALTDIHTSQTNESEVSENPQQLENEDAETEIFQSIEGGGTSKLSDEQLDVRVEAQALTSTDDDTFQVTKSEVFEDQPSEKVDISIEVKSDETSTARFSFWQPEVDVESEASVLTDIPTSQASESGESKDQQQLETEDAETHVFPSTEGTARSGDEQPDVRVEAPKLISTDANTFQATESEASEDQQLDSVFADSMAKSDETSTTRFSFWQSEIDVEYEASPLTDIHTSQTNESEGSGEQQPMDQDTDSAPCSEATSFSRSSVDPPNACVESTTSVLTDVYSLTTRENELCEDQMSDTKDAANANRSAESVDMSNEIVNSKSGGVEAEINVESAISAWLGIDAFKTTANEVAEEQQPETEDAESVASPGEVSNSTNTSFGSGTSIRTDIVSLQTLNTDQDQSSDTKDAENADRSAKIVDKSDEIVNFKSSEVQAGIDFGSEAPALIGIDAVHMAVNQVIEEGQAGAEDAESHTSSDEIARSGFCPEPSNASFASWTSVGTDVKSLQTAMCEVNADQNYNTKDEESGAKADEVQTSSVTQTPEEIDFGAEVSALIAIDAVQTIVNEVTLERQAGADDVASTTTCSSDEIVKSRSSPELCISRGADLRTDIENLQTAVCQVKADQNSNTKEEDSGDKSDDIQHPRSHDRQPKIDVDSEVCALIGTDAVQTTADEEATLEKQAGAEDVTSITTCNSEAIVKSRFSLEPSNACVESGASVRNDVESLQTTVCEINAGQNPDTKDEESVDKADGIQTSRSPAEPVQIDIGSKVSALTMANNASGDKQLEPEDTVSMTSSYEISNVRANAEPSTEDVVYGTSVSTDTTRFQSTECELAADQPSDIEGRYPITVDVQGVKGASIATSKVGTAGLNPDDRLENAPRPELSRQGDLEISPLNSDSFFLHEPAELLEHRIQNVSMYLRNLDPATTASWVDSEYIDSFGPIQHLEPCNTSYTACVSFRTVSEMSSLATGELPFYGTASTDNKDLGHEIDNDNKAEKEPSEDDLVHLPVSRKEDGQAWESPSRRGTNNKEVAVCDGTIGQVSRSIPKELRRIETTMIIAPRSMEEESCPMPMCSESMFDVTKYVDYLSPKNRKEDDSCQGNSKSPRRIEMTTMIDRRSAQEESCPVPMCSESMFDVTKYVDYLSPKNRKEADSCQGNAGCLAATIQTINPFEGISEDSSEATSVSSEHTGGYESWLSSAHKYLEYLSPTPSCDEESLSYQEKKVLKSEGNGLRSLYEQYKAETYEESLKAFLDSHSYSAVGNKIRCCTEETSESDREDKDSTCGSIEPQVKAKIFTFDEPNTTTPAETETTSPCQSCRPMESTKGVHVLDIPSSNPTTEQEQEIDTRHDDTISALCNTVKGERRTPENVATPSPSKTRLDKDAGPTKEQAGSFDENFNVDKYLEYLTPKADDSTPTKEYRSKSAAPSEKETNEKEPTPYQTQSFEKVKELVDQGTNEQMEPSSTDRLVIDTATPDVDNMDKYLNYLIPEISGTETNGTRSGSPLDEMLEAAWDEMLEAAKSTGVSGSSTTCSSSQTQSFENADEASANSQDTTTKDQTREPLATDRVIATQDVHNFDKYLTYITPKDSDPQTEGTQAGTLQEEISKAATSIDATDSLAVSSSQSSDTSSSDTKYQLDTENKDETANAMVSPSEGEDACTLPATEQSLPSSATEPCIALPASNSNVTTSTTTTEEFSDPQEMPSSSSSYSSSSYSVLSIEEEVDTENTFAATSLTAAMNKELAFHSRRPSSLLLSSLSPRRSDSPCSRFFGSENHLLYLTTPTNATPTPKTPNMPTHGSSPISTPRS